jgi:UDP-N-acetylmuramoylalanine--D-glutamate ligase
LKTAILGIGKSGISALKLALANSIDTYVINLGDPKEWRCSNTYLEQLPLNRLLAQDDSHELLKEVDWIVKSPGIDPRIQLFEGIDQAKIISEVEWAFRFYTGNAKIISITGSNGKTTTSTMLANYLELIGKKVFLGGNIGIAVCDFVNINSDVDYIVLELSSFQLENISKFKTNYAVILNIMENHTERYDSLKDYANAKYNLIDHVQDKVLINRDCLFFHDDSSFITFSSNDKVKLPMLLPGEHNRNNAFVVEKLISIMNEDNSKLADFLLEFSGVEHRLEFLGDFNGLKVFNDSKSTNMVALEAALSGLTGMDNYLILTGQPRGSENLAAVITPYKSHLNKIYIYGAAQALAFDDLVRKDLLVDIINELKGKSGTLIFSPGFPSFDLYESFEQRGEEFKQNIYTILG